MKQVAKALRSRFLPVLQQTIERVTISRAKKVDWDELAADEELLEEPTTQQEKQLEGEIKHKGILERAAHKLRLKYPKHAAKTH